MEEPGADTTADSRSGSHPVISEGLRGPAVTSYVQQASQHALAQHRHSKIVQRRQGIAFQAAIVER